MPVYQIPPELQALISGRTIQPTLGPGLDAFAQSLREEQAGQRAMVDQIGRQTPGFMEYLTANHPDIMESVTGTPRMFRGKGEPPLSGRLQSAMQAFQAAQAAAPLALTGEQTVGLNLNLQKLIDGDPVLRTRSPEEKTQAGALLNQIATSKNPSDSAKARVAYEALIGQRPSETMQKFMDASEVLGLPIFGELPLEYRMDKAYQTATGTPIATEDDRLLARLTDEQKYRNLQLDAANKKQELLDKQNAEANGKPISAIDSRKFAQLDFALKRSVRAIEMTEGLKTLETSLGNLRKAPAYEAKAGELAAILATVSLDYLRFAMEYGTRPSAVLLEMAGNELVAYDKTPTQIRSVLRVVTENMLDMYESRLRQLSMSGMGSDKYFSAQAENLKPYYDAAIALAKEQQKKGGYKPSKGFFGITGFGPGPGTTPATPEDILSGEEP